jgi:hypothetical protein
MIQAQLVEGDQIEWQRLARGARDSETELAQKLIIKKCLKLNLMQPVAGVQTQFKFMASAGQVSHIEQRLLLPFGLITKPS